MSDSGFTILTLSGKVIEFASTHEAKSAADEILSRIKLADRIRKVKELRERGPLYRIGDTVEFGYSHFKPLYVQSIKEPTEEHPYYGYSDNGYTFYIEDELRKPYGS